MNIRKALGPAMAFGRGASGDSVAAWGRDVLYALSYDRTVMYRVDRVTPGRKGDPVAFRVSDFESTDVKREGPALVFNVGDGALVRVAAPAETFEGLEALFTRFDLRGEPDAAAVMLTSKDAMLLDGDLPHVEFVARGGAFKIVQRDFYSGRTLEVERKAMSGTGSVTMPLAMRTQDFKTLFQLATSYVIKVGDGWFYADNLADVRAVVGGCLYEDVGRLNALAEEV